MLDLKKDYPVKIQNILSQTGGELNKCENVNKACKEEIEMYNDPKYKACIIEKCIKTIQDSDPKNNCKITPIRIEGDSDTLEK